MSADESVQSRGTRRSRKGVVLRRSGDKTIVVEVEQRRRHPVYDKVMRQSSKLHVHDEKNQATQGDTVTVVETRPLSKMKRWRLLTIAANTHNNPAPADSAAVLAVATEGR